MDLGKFEGVLGVFDGQVYCTEKTDLIRVNLGTKEELRVPFDSWI